MRYASGQTGKQTDRQTDRQTNTLTTIPREAKSLSEHAGNITRSVPVTVGGVHDTDVKDLLTFLLTWARSGEDA